MFSCLIVFVCGGFAFWRFGNFVGTLHILYCLQLVGTHSLELCFGFCI